MRWRGVLLTAWLLCWAGVAPARADITVATAGPVTGQLAALGAQMLAGAKAAVRDLNEAGGLLGETVRLVIGDDQCDPKQAVSVANKLVGDGVVFVAGHFCSSSSIPASAVYSEADIIQMSPASTAPALTEKGRLTVFRVCGRDDQQGGVAGAYIARRFADARVAVLHDKTAYGKGLADEARKAMIANGKHTELYEAYTAGEKDYTALVSKMKRARIDLVFVGGYHTEVGLILRQMRQQGMKTRLMAGDALVTQEFWAIVGEDGEGTLFTFAPDPRLSPAAAALVETFRAAGTEPEGYVLYTYAAFQAFAQAVRAAGSSSGDKVAAALRSGRFETVIGAFRFDAKGDVDLPPYAVYQWSKGKYRQLPE